MYESETRGVRITVEPQFLDSRSAPEAGRFVWAYTVLIENRGPEPVQLRTRHWKITDANGNVQEVNGDGVVGEQPTIEPGRAFRYTSGAPLPTPSGFMGGAYRMVSASGKAFDAVIPTFSLDSPHDPARRRPN